MFSKELAATSTSLAGEDECETSGGTSGEDIWGTPTSGDSELTSPILEVENNTLQVSLCTIEAFLTEWGCHTGKGKIDGVDGGNEGVVSR